MVINRDLYCQKWTKIVLQKCTWQLNVSLFVQKNQMLALSHECHQLLVNFQVLMNIIFWWPSIFDEHQLLMNSSFGEHPLWWTSTVDEISFWWTQLYERCSIYCVWCYCCQKISFWVCLRVFWLSVHKLRVVCKLDIYFRYFLCQTLRRCAIFWWQSHALRQD
jgi:hypothetical protein